MPTLLVVSNRIPFVFFKHKFSARMSAAKARIVEGLRQLISEVNEASDRMELALESEFTACNPLAEHWSEVIAAGASLRPAAPQDAAA